MSDVTWINADGVWTVSGWPLRTTVPIVCVCDGGWCVVGDQGTTHATLEAAQLAALEGAVGDLGKLKSKIADCEALLSAARRHAQDGEDAALVATHCEVVWESYVGMRATCHTATVAGHPCHVEDYGDGGVKWWLEPEHYGHPHTWYAPDVETAKIRAAAAALREPCKRWRVTIPGERIPTASGWMDRRGGAATVWARTSEGAIYRAALAIGRPDFVAMDVKGRAVEVVE